MNSAVGSGGGTVVQNFHPTRGAVMTQDIVNRSIRWASARQRPVRRGGHALAARDMAQMRRPKL